jgi:hypothetical protein
MEVVPWLDVVLSEVLKHTHLASTSHSLAVKCFGHVSTGQ